MESSRCCLEVREMGMISFRESGSASVECIDCYLVNDKTYDGTACVISRSILFS